MQKQGLLRSLAAPVLAAVVAFSTLALSAQTVPDTDLSHIHQSRREAFSNRVLLSVSSFPEQTDWAALHHYRTLGAQVIAVSLFEAEQRSQGVGLLRQGPNNVQDNDESMWQKISLNTPFSAFLADSSVADSVFAGLVGLIRRFRPQVVLTGLPGRVQQQVHPLVERAFAAAADTSVFSDQLENGLEPWQPARLFRPLAAHELGSAVVGFRALFTPQPTRSRIVSSGEFRSFALVKKAPQSPGLSGHKDLFAGLPGFEHDLKQLPDVFVRKIRRAAERIAQAANRLPAERRAIAAAALEIRNQLAGFLAASRDDLSEARRSFWRDRAERMNRLALRALGVTVSLRAGQAFAAAGDSVRTRLEIRNVGQEKLALAHVSVHFIRPVAKGGVRRSEYGYSAAVLKQRGEDELAPADGYAFDFIEPVAEIQPGQEGEMQILAQIAVRWRNRELFVQRRMHVGLRPALEVAATRADILWPAQHTGAVPLIWQVGKNSSSPFSGVLRLRTETGTTLQEQALHLAIGPAWTVAEFRVPATPRTRKFIVDVVEDDSHTVEASAEVIVRQVDVVLPRREVVVGMLGQDYSGLALVLESLGVTVRRYDFAALTRVSLQECDVFILPAQALARNAELATALPRLLAEVRSGARLIAFPQPASVWNARWNRSADKGLSLFLDEDERLGQRGGEGLQVAPESVLLQQPNAVRIDSLLAAVPPVLAGAPAQHGPAWQVVLSLGSEDLILQAGLETGQVMYLAVPWPARPNEAALQMLANLLDWHRPPPLTAN